MKRNQPGSVILFSLPLLISLMVSKPAVAQEPGKMTFQAGVSVAQYLPAAMYGQWSVTATLIETNAPNVFAKLINDLWVLELANNRVTVTNPNTGASAAVHVDQVNGNTARFRRIVVPSPKRRFIETPTVTVDGDNLNGWTEDRIDFIKDGVVTKSIYGRYQLVANRISGARLQFGQEVPSDELEFEIEDIKREDPTVKPIK